MHAYTHANGCILFELHMHVFLCIFCELLHMTLVRDKEGDHSDLRFNNISIYLETYIRIHIDQYMYICMNMYVQICENIHIHI